MNEQKLLELEQKIQELEREIEKRNNQQISLPLDPASISVVAKALQDAGYIIT